jgi:FkbM family methyltransferase
MYNYYKNAEIVIKTKCKCDGPLILMRGDLISEFINENGFWEDVISYIVTKVVDPYRNCIDAGANLGWYSILLSKFINEKCNVYSFEPQRMIYNQLCGNIFINKIVNCYTYNVAISDKNGYVHLRNEQTAYGRGKGDWPINQGGLSIEKESDKETYKSFEEHSGEQVETVRLDDVSGLENVGFIKMDVETHEIEALTGAINLIKSSRPIILVEMFGESPKKAKQLFESNKLGYGSFKFDSDGNYFLIPKEKWESVIRVVNQGMQTIMKENNL